VKNLAVIVALSLAIAEASWAMGRPKRNELLTEAQSLGKKISKLNHDATPFLLDPKGFTPRMLAESQVYDQGIYEEVNSFKVKGRSSFDDFLKKAEKSSVILIADSHRIPSRQRTAERVIQHLLQANSRPKLFVFELIDAAYQADVDAYFEGKISGEELKKKVEWDRNIGYAWESYQALLDFLNKNNVKTIVALRPDPALHILDMRRRDKYTFDRVKAELDREALTQAVVLQGADHLSGRAGLTPYFYRQYPGRTVRLLSKLANVHFEILKKSYPLSETLFVKLKGGVFPNTYYWHTNDPTSAEVGIIGWLSGAIVSETAPGAAEIKSRLEAASQSVTDSYLKLVELAVQGNGVAFNQQRREFDTYFSLWARELSSLSEKSVAPGLEKVRGEIRESIEDILKDR
jgi:hypothetical protein